MLLALAAALQPWAPVLGLPPEGKPKQVVRAQDAAQPAKLRTGRALFENRCRRCHGDDGTGSPVRDRIPEIPNFTSGRWQASHSDGQLQASILEGSGTRMPSFRGVIREEQLDALVAQLRAFGPAGAGAGAGAGSTSRGDFDSRMRKLDEELKELQRQFRELSRAPQKP
jgi:mono/diheme cytochrome c family protein